MNEDLNRVLDIIDNQVLLHKWDLSYPIESVKDRTKGKIGALEILKGSIIREFDLKKENSVEVCVK